MFPIVGEQFRQYRILSKAGEGGMGVVFRAQDTRLGRDVALKFLSRIGSVDSGEAERLRLEARSLAALHHANIVTIFDIDEENDAPFLVLEWVSGTSLDDASYSRPWDEGEFLRIALPVTEALAAAHTRGIVHRDLKRANVLLADDGGVKLVDFGLAKLRDVQLRLTKTATVVGTVSCMSPEQAIGSEVGTASDVFSFGVLAYELLAGRLPFEGESSPALLFAIVHTPHVPLAARRSDLSPEMTAIVERCLQKRPENRYANGAELAQDARARAPREVQRSTTVGPRMARRSLMRCMVRVPSWSAYSAGSPTSRWSGSGPRCASFGSAWLRRTP